MHRLILFALAAALFAGCTKPCQELADRICKCGPTGTSEETCKQQVNNALSGVSGSDQDAACSDYLDSCDAHGADFCLWLDTAEGKRACGLAY